MDDDTEVTVVERPFEPEATRKKGLREPAETVRLAQARPGKAVVHSEGHTSQNAARSAVKRIHAGRFSAWRDFRGKIHAYVIPYDDETYGVAVTWVEKGDEAK